MLLTIIDLAILVFVAGAGVRMAYLGVHAHKGEFVVWGLLLGFFAVWQGIRQEATQQSWTKLLNGVSSDVKMLKDKPPVQVIVPPPLSPPTPSKQRAVMEIPDNGIKFDHNSQYGWWVNVECLNAGIAVTAKNGACEAFIKEIPTEQGAPTKKSFEEVWDEFSKMSFHPALVDLEPGKGIVQHRAFAQTIICAVRVNRTEDVEVWAHGIKTNGWWCPWRCPSKKL